MVNSLRSNFSKFVDFIIKYRWIIAFTIFVIAVFFRLHMSSIGEFNKYFPTVSDDYSYKEIIGHSRSIRSDEWAVQTPTFFSQAYSGYAMTSYQKSLGGINMVLDYYAPVFDFTLIGKPFNWGYILFGNEIGLSWYWSLFVILLFMLAFEMFWIITKHNRVLSIVGSLMIGFSPAIQWWMMPHMPVVFLYAMWLFVVGYYFFTTKSTLFSWVLTILGIIGFVGYALSIFPSIQIIMGIVALSLLIACLYRDKDLFKFKVKSIRCLKLVIMLCATGVVLGYFLLTSKESISLLMNTAYPGERVSMGGDGTLSSLFPTLYSMFLPYKDANILNNCELATFIHFCPVVLVLFPLISKKLRENNDSIRYVGVTLFSLIAIEILFMCVGFTELQAKLTLFSYNNRMQISYGFTSVIFTIWGINALWKYPEILSKKQKIIIPLVFLLFYITLLDANIIAYAGVLLPLIEISIFAIAVLLFIMRKKVLFALWMSIIMIEAGATINPLCSGIGAITDHPISEEINNISTNDKNAIWLTTGDNSSIVANFVAANGGRVLNGTNFLPDFTKWDLLDTDRENEEIYNRYANQYVYLTTEETTFENKYADTIDLYLNPQDLDELGITYILSNQDDAEEILTSYQISYEVEEMQDNYKIIHLLAG